MPTAPEAVSSDGGTVASATRFDGVLDPGGASFYSLRQTQQTRSIRATLQSLTAPGRPEVVPVPLSVGVGVPRGEGCAVSESVETPSGLVLRAIRLQRTGTWCVTASACTRHGPPAVHRDLCDQLQLPMSRNMTGRVWNITVAAVLAAACGGNGITAPEPAPTSPGNRRLSAADVGTWLDVTQLHCRPRAVVSVTFGKLPNCPWESASVSPPAAPAAGPASRW